MKEWNTFETFDQENEKKKKRRTWIACGVIALLLLCAACAVGGTGILALFSPPQNLNVTIIGQPEVTAGEAFDLEVRLQNNGNRPITISSISLPKSELITVLASSPASQGQTDLGDKIEYTFSLPLAPGETRAVSFRLRASGSGEYSGEIEVWVGTHASYHRFRIALQAAPTEAAPSMIEALSRSVVQIIALVDVNGEEIEGWSGSGTIISSDGLILTNAHVVLSDRYYKVKKLLVALTTSADRPPERKYFAEVMQADEALDIAVIRIHQDLSGNPVDRTTLRLPAARLGDSDALQLGDPLIIIGYPGIGGETITVTRGEVAGFTSESGVGNRAFIKTSATIAGGNSGGMAANAKGELIGIPTRVGAGETGDVVDCRPLADTNRDGQIDDRDACVPVGGFLNALRPIRLAMPYIEAARRGEVNFVEKTPEETPLTSSGREIFRDDFSSSRSGWPSGGDQDYQVGYAAGAYSIRVKSKNILAWATHDTQFTDGEITVEARVMDSVGDGEYGIICRYQDADNFYFFLISEDGYFSIQKFEKNEQQILFDWEHLTGFDPAGPNRITAICVGNKLQLAVNDYILATAYDDSFQSGNIGLIAGTFSTPGLRVTFDNLVVKER
jgi:S1-C subfamily serine protease